MNKNLNKLEVINKLDISVNKDDLMEMLLDKKLSELESKLNINNEQLKTVNAAKLEIYRGLVLEQVELKLDKFSKLISKKKLVEVIKASVIVANQQYGKDNINHHTFNIKIADELTLQVYVKLNIKKLIDDFESELEALYAENNRLKQEIELINKSGKRVKSRMLANILKESEDGKAILELINKKDLKLLDFNTNG